MLGQRLAQLREERKLSQERFADEIGASRSAVSLWELGERQPRRAWLEKIASFFDVSVDYLLGRTSVRQHDEEDRPIPESDLDAYLRQHDLWFKGQPLTYAEKLAARQAIELLRKAMEASKEEPGKEDLEGKS